MSTGFTIDGSAIIEEKLDVGDVTATPEHQLVEKYQLVGCCNWIANNNYKTAALQFPDELLVDSVQIALYLEGQTECKMFILADTSYGSCCVDEVAADHVAADCVVHFGHSCLSATSRLPVHLVFVESPLDVSDVVDAVCPSLCGDRPVVVFADVQYQHALVELCSQLSARLPTVVAAEPVLPSPTDSEANTDTGTTVLLNRRVPLSAADLRDSTILHVGSEGRTLTCLAMTAADTRLLSYDPSTGQPPVEQGAISSRAIRRRYYMVERVKDARRVGILVGTLAVRRFPELIARLKTVLRAAGKRHYTLVCGKLSAAKLANFPELDVFVLVSCAESALLDSREFLAPVVTPLEVELACNPRRAWSPRYVLQFDRLLPGGADHVPLPERPQPVADVSLVTGMVRHVGGPERDDDGDAADTQLQTRHPLTVALHVGGAGQALAERGWRGLEISDTPRPVTAAVQGLCGVAAGYEREGERVPTADRPAGEDQPGHR